MTETPSLRIRARLDTDAAIVPGSTAARSGREKDGPDRSPFLLVEVLAEGCCRRGAVLRRPLELALVVDASRSMGDRRRIAALLMVRRMVDRLLPCDRVTLLSFAGEVRIHLDRMPMDPVGRNLAIKTLREVTARQGSNVAKGWYEAALRIMKGARPQDGTARKVILLTDGMADRGILEPGELACMASDLRGHGLVTSAVAIGSRCRTVHLSALCDAGGGRLHHADHHDEIDEPSMWELLDNRNSVVESVRVELAVPEGLRVENTALVPDGGDGERNSFPVGPLVPGSCRAFLFRLGVVDGEPGRKLRLRARAHFRRPGNPATDLVESNWVFLELREKNPASRRIPNTLFGHRIAALWRDGLVRRIVALDSSAGAIDAIDSLRTTVESFRGYCGQLSDAGEYLRDVDAAMDAGRAPGERRSVDDCACGRNLDRDMEYRVLRRTAWSTCLKRMAGEDDLRP